MRTSRKLPAPLKKGKEPPQGSLKFIILVDTKSSSKVTGGNVHIEYAQIIFLLVFPKHYDLTMCMTLHSSCVVQGNLNRLRMTQNSWEHMYKPKANVMPFPTNEGLWFFKGPGNISPCILRSGCLSIIIAQCSSPGQPFPGHFHIVTIKANDG